MKKLKGILKATEADWLQQLQKRCGPDAEICVAQLEFKAADEDDDGAVYVEGMASTDDVDRYADIVAPAAFKKNLKTYLKDGTFLFMHQWSDMPLGKVEKAEIRENGLWIRAKIVATDLGIDVIKLIKEGILKAFSIGFRTLKYTYDEEAEIRTITDLELLEVSVVNIPANPAALFSQAKQYELKALTFNTEPGNRPDKKGNRKMDGIQLTQEHLDAIRKMEKIVGQWEDTDGTVSSKFTQLGDNIIQLNKNLNAMQEQANKKHDGLITMGEFTTFGEKMTADVKGLSEDIRAVRAATEVTKQRYPISDWRSLLKDEEHLIQVCKFITDDDGKPRPLGEQKAYMLFQAPVAKDHADAELLMKIRDLHDYLLLKSAVAMFKSRRFDVRMLPEYEVLRKCVEPFDKAFSEKAMYSTGSTLGDEWVPTLFSSQMEDLYRLEPTAEMWFRSWNMPSNPATWPIKAGGATAYRGGEAATNNPSEAKKTEFTTGNVTFTAEVIIAALPVAPELIEDSIVEMVPEIRGELTRALADGAERAILNGDSAGTHQDTTHSYGTDALETAWLGGRAKAFDDSMTFDTQSTTAGVGDGAATFGAKDVRYTRAQMGVAGKKSSELVTFCNIHVWFLVMGFDEVAKQNEAGRTSTWVTGDLESIDGVPLAVTENMHQTQAATGLETAASTHSSTLTMNRNIWMMGTKRGVTVEYEKNIRTQQHCFVATSRKDFAPLCPSTVYPAGVGFNIE